jgi:phage terminase small subunit
MVKRKLTHLQERFKNFLLEGMTQTDAYLAAGYKCSRSAARRNAARLMTNADILTEIIAGQKRAANAAEITQERILREYAKIAFLNPKLLYDENGKLKAVHKLDKAIAAAIGGMDILQRQTKNGDIEVTKKIKLIDKKGALDSLARIKGMFNDKLNLGFSAEVLNAILSGLPDEFAQTVRAELGKLISRR